MPQGTQQPYDSPLSGRASMNLGMSIVRIWAASLEVFLHSGMGHRYLGLQAAAVLGLVPIYMLFWQGYDLRPLLWFLMAYLAMCLVNRIGNLARSSERRHSYYTGWPRLMGRKSRLSELAVKRVLEPLLVFCLGGAVRDSFNAPLGTYLMIGAGCLCLSVSLSVLEDEARATDMADAVIEQEVVAERFREMRGGE